MNALSARGAAILSSSSLYMFQLTMLLYSMYIARLFTPEQLGIYTIVVAIVGLCEIIKSGGISSYLIREKNLSENTVRSCLGISTLFSFSLGLILIVSAEWIAALFNIVEIETFILISSINFFLSPVIAVNSALLIKDFHFYRNIAIGWTYAAFSISSTLILYNITSSIYSLAWGGVIGTIAQCFVSILVSHKLMSYRPMFSELRKILGFSSKLVGSALLEKMVESTPDFVIGKLGPPADVAFKSKGMSAVNLISHTVISGFRPVALPYFSGENYSNASAYIKATNLVQSIATPIILSLVIFGSALILLLFGDQWVNAAQLAAPLAVWGTFRSFNPFFREILIANNNESLIVKRACLELTVTVTSVSLGYTFFGLYGSAIGLCLSAASTSIYTHYLVAKSLQVSVFYLLFEYKRIFALTFLCLLGATVVGEFLLITGVSDILFLVLGFIAMAIIWVALVFLLRLDISNEIKRVVSHLSNKIR